MGFCCLVYISVMAFGNKYANFLYEFERFMDLERA